MESLPLYQDKLYHPEVYKHLYSIVMKIKGNKKMEFKNHAEIFLETLTQYRNASQENQDAATNAQADKNGSSKINTHSTDLLSVLQLNQEKPLETDATLSQEEEEEREELRRHKKKTPRVRKLTLRKKTVETDEDETPNKVEGRRRHEVNDGSSPVINFEKMPLDSETDEESISPLKAALLELDETDGTASEAEVLVRDSKLRRGSLKKTPREKKERKRCIFFNFRLPRSGILSDSE